MNHKNAGLNTDIIIITKKSVISTVTSDFFSGAGIIEEGELELASKPILAPAFARVEYKDNADKSVIVTAEANNRVIFSETINDKSFEQPLIKKMACKYTQTLPNLDYEAVLVSFRNFLSFPDSQDEAIKYIASNFLTNGSWQTIGKSPVRASIDLVFDMEHAPLYLKIASATMRLEDETTIPVVMFSGSFSYILDGESAAEKLAYIHECIGNWQTDFDAFTDIVNNNFIVQNAVESSYQLQAPVETETNLFAMSAAI